MGSFLAQKKLESMHGFVKNCALNCLQLAFLVSIDHEQTYDYDLSHGLVSIPEAKHVGELRDALYGDAGTVAGPDCIHRYMKMVTWL